MTVRLDVGALVGDYEILAVAGVGGMGIVYKARQRSLGRVVALKVIRDEIACTPDYRERFLREARLAASVDHPHVVSVYDVGDRDGRLFLAMQWIDGQDLRRTIGHGGRLAPERAVAIACQLAGALDAVHGIAGLVHRDVKPANVMLRQVSGHDHAYLTDFGVAKPSQADDRLTQTGSVVGTTGYLSPEQIMGQAPGPRSDLYALGCLFFETLTGHPPFHGDNEMALRWAHANQPRPTASSVIPDLGARYDEFLSTALAVDPNQRFGSGREFAAALTAAQSAPQSGADAAATTAIAPLAPIAVGPPTPIPVPVNTPQPPVPVYQQSYGYATPPPAAAPPPSRSGNSLALILLGVVALAGIAVGALAATGAFSHSGGSASATTTQVAFSSDTTTTPVHVTHVKPRRVVVTPRTATATATVTATGAPSAGVTSCGGDLSVGPNTSCAFAANVEQAYSESGGGDTTVSAYSPDTGRTYTIDCTGGVPHVCTGGTTNAAGVYFTSGPTSGQPVTPTPSGSQGSLRACDQNISAGSATTCPFAENVFVAYYDDYKANGVQSDNTVDATSPVTHQTYAMNCSTDGATVTCTGGTNSFVTFPLHAVEVY